MAVTAIARSVACFRPRAGGSITRRSSGYGARKACSPWENGYNERFNGTLRHEVLKTEWFTSIDQARVVITQWLRQHNHIRPHHALGMRPPVPETILEKPKISGSD